MGKLKKDRQIRLFSMWMRVEEYFGKYKKERYFTHEGVKGKVRRLKEENESEPNVARPAS